MNCSNHTNESAISKCPDCNKGLCFKCSEEFSFPICNSCNITRKSNEKRKIYLELFTTFGIGLVLTYLLTLRNSSINQNLSYSFLLSMYYMCSGIVPGWRLISNFLPKYIFSLSIFYFGFLVIKFILSLFVGIIALPIRLVQNIQRLTKLNN